LWRIGGRLSLVRRKISCVEIGALQSRGTIEWANSGRNGSVGRPESAARRCREETRMAAYLIVDIHVKNPDGYDEYRRQVPATLAKYGGRFVVRGGASETLEGEWMPKRVVVVEFPTMDALKRWYHSPEYKPLIALRQQNSSGDVIAVEGA
jgi:uncharacterized protein (DUF1330 family)